MFEPLFSLCSAAFQPPFRHCLPPFSHLRRDLKLLPFPVLRAHKKICGTIEGYKLCSSEEQSRSNGSDDGHGSDDDKKSPGPEVLNIGNKEKDDSGIGDKINRSEDEVFSDAVADFSDSQGVKESLQEGSLDSSTSVEWDGKDDPKFSGSSKDSDFNGKN
ncbi:hypothetical protein Ahy_A09g044341 [Arachis hypogaea]|uniref:Uncharacterized protein n=1 Tax=Arachis hypogaea TaxID=3818 RepID=A0A445BJW2_ARAHY|nr:hypothetical protein Ahy_A09g044341 [Arachis hypogaea]